MPAADVVIRAKPCCTRGTLCAPLQAIDRSTGYTYNADLSDYTAAFSSVSYASTDGFSGVTDANVPKAAVVLTRSATLKNGNKLPDERFVYVFTLDAEQKIVLIELYAPLRSPLP